MKLVAVVLAAGSARRFGSDKLSAPLAGEPLVFHAIRAARAAPVERVIAVAHPRLDIGAWSGDPPVDAMRLDSAALSQSLKTALDAALESDGALDGLFVFLGDMPRVPHQAAGRLAKILGPAYAALPRQGGRTGHPVLLSARAFADIALLEGDAGAGKLLRARDDVVFDECSDPLIHADVDRPEDLSRMAGGSWFRES